MSKDHEAALSDLRQQWLDLRAQHGRGALDAEAYATARTTLEQRIVAAVVDTAAPPAEPAAVAAAAPAAASPTSPSATPAPVPGMSGRFLGVVAVFVLVVAGLGYGWKGSPRAVGTPPPEFAQGRGGGGGGGAGGSPQRGGAEQLDTLVKQLQERLDKQPGDTEGWRLLARSLMTLGRYAEAAAAYQKALAIKPDDANVITDYADALGVLNGRTLEGEPQRLLERALKIDPKHIKALVLMGTLEFQRSNWPAAQKRWEEVVRIGPAGDGLVELAREGVSQAQARQQRNAAGPGTPASAAPRAAAPADGKAPATAAMSGAAGVRGTVRLAAALKAQAAPGDTVFIFARAAGGVAGGGGMPLAIVQKRVSDLPATFSLDDSQAMSPAARLSAAQQVVVTARVSKSGQAVPQPGDLEGTSAPVAPGSAAARELVVEISNVRR